LTAINASIASDLRYLRIKWRERYYTVREDFYKTGPPLHEEAEGSIVRDTVISGEYISTLLNASTF
jgi:hypothetical protein